MRAVVACGPFQNLTSAQTGAALARAWAELGVQLAVVPIAEAGRGFGRAWADLCGGRDVPHPAGAVFVGPAGITLRVDAQGPSTSEGVGVALVEVLAWARREGHSCAELWLEVPEFTWADGGEGFWRQLARQGDPRALLDGVLLHLVTTRAQAAMHLTGLRGITAAGALGSGAHPGELIAADQALVDWCQAMGDASLGTTAGAGAVGGLGAAVLALGGDVVTGPGECARLSGLAQTIAQAELVVTGYDELEFGTKGGDLIPTVTELAEQAMRPVIAVNRRNWISARELRTMGIEEGYEVTRQDRPIEPEEITRAALPVARTWSW
ncbi:glycerate kinase [Luteococcus sp. OSA5]|uniref:glycerate kinase n=1 Tax=Luteococcus sp. OSA5 TaxID=3401630 RepID=UPI003B42ED2A